MNSPFPYETFALSKQFYGRDEEISKLKDIVSTSNNALLYSKRRMGKSSLVKELFKQVENEYITIYVDLFDITSPEDFAKLLFKEIARVQKGDLKSVIESLKKLFTRVTFGINVDPNSGEMSFSPRILDLEFDEMIEEIFSSLFKLCEKRKVIVAFDEFQQIVQFKDTKIDGLLRKYIQEPKDISYIFLGSKRHTLNELFRYKAPLYEMATFIELESLTLDSISGYVGKYLKISEENLQYLCELSDYETKLIQHICHILYFADLKQIEKKDIDKALNEILNSKFSSFTLIYDSFSTMQRKAFKIISKNKTNIFTAEVLKNYNISKSSLNSALNQLFKKEIIDKREDLWFIPDRTLELWGKHKLES